MWKPPDWLVYGGVVAVLLAAAAFRRDHVDSPRPPPPVPGAAEVGVTPNSPFAAAALRKVPRHLGANAATAFSADVHGDWLTAARAMRGCTRPRLVVADGWSVPASLRAVSGDVAVLTTPAGAPALGFAAKQPVHSDTAFAAGFARAGPVEAAGLYLGMRGGRALWSEIGRTDSFSGPLFGTAGAPLIAADGEVTGMVLADAPRRGRLTVAPVDALQRALAAAKIKPAPVEPVAPITLDNYGRAADALRRALSVAEVICG